MSDQSPQNASQIYPWFSDTWSQLCVLIERGSLPHALLLEGITGTGRNGLAMNLAQRLLCESSEANQICGDCRPCNLFEAGTHSDFLQLVPEEAGKAIGIAGVRAAINFASGTASLGTRKVTLVSPAEAMTTASFNAFLKSLEEPSNESFIILLAAKGASLPATVRSRCQRWLLSAPTSQQAQEWLRTASADDPVPAERITELLRVAANQPLTALDYWADQRAESQLALDAALDAVVKGDSKAPLMLRTATEAVTPPVLLDQLERKTHVWLKAQKAETLRTPQGVGIFRLLDEVRHLRRALVAGTNPNPDLLRFRLVTTWVGLWGL